MFNLTKAKLITVANNITKLGYLHEARVLIKLAHEEFNAFDDFDLKDLPGELQDPVPQNMNDYRNHLIEESFMKMDRIKEFMSGNNRVSRGELFNNINDLNKLLKDYEDSLPDPI